MVKTAYFSFCSSLIDFLPRRTKDVVPYHFTGIPTIKDAIEAIFVPHVEVDVILINNKPVQFYQRRNNRNEVDVFLSEEELHFQIITGYGMWYLNTNNLY